jgi:hypothetical protein
MNMPKHMEAVFLFSLAGAGPASIAYESINDANAKPATTAVTSVARTQQAIPVVVVSAKRMTAEEKRQSLEDEARQGSIRVASRSSF